MNRSKERLLVRFVSGVVAACLTLVASGPSLDAQSFPQYDHVFLLIMENENYNQVIGNRYAPILNALAQDYGLATNYRGVADPSEPNYVAMLGGDFFGINSDDPYWFPGHTVNANNLMSQLEGAGKTWKGYFQRSEEHTSELQSRLHLVCRLLLEKKKTSHAEIKLTVHVQLD